MVLKTVHEVSKNFLGKEFNELDDDHQNIVNKVVDRQTISADLKEDNLTFGQRIADKVAAFGGSWTFIGIFAFILFVWVIINSIILVNWGNPFDPYPYILLNLFLSMLAAIQAPIIMMSQNRQAAKDRLIASNDYKTSIKNEVEIMALHSKIDKVYNEITGKK